MTEHIKIIVVEGPAGGGKTTLIGNMASVIYREKPIDQASVIPVGMPFEFEPPRSYERSNELRDYGTAMAYAKDLSRLAMLSGYVKNDAEGKNFYVLDRFLLSSFVYGRLRLSAAGAIRAHQLEARRERLTFINTLVALPRILNMYMGRHPGSHLYSGHTGLSISVLFVANLPTSGQINERRSHCQRAFPYTAQDEFWEYRDVVMNLIGVSDDEMVPTEASRERSSFLVLGDEGLDKPDDLNQFVEWVNR